MTELTASLRGCTIDSRTTRGRERLPGGNEFPPGCLLALAAARETRRVLRSIAPESSEVAPERTDALPLKAMLALQPRTRCNGLLHGLVRNSGSTQLESPRSHLNEFLGTSH